MQQRALPDDAVGRAAALHPVLQQSVLRQQLGGAFRNQVIDAQNLGNKGRDDLQQCNIALERSLPPTQPMHREHPDGLLTLHDWQRDEGDRLLRQHGPVHGTA